MAVNTKIKVYGLVPARSGSQGLPDKNILEIDGHPLMAYAIAYGKRLNLDRLLVSTDSEKYAKLAVKYGAECPYLRSYKASTDNAREEDILFDLDKNLATCNIDVPDIWVWLKPTNPFRCLDAGKEGIKILANNPDIDSVRIVSESDIRLQTINSDGFLETVTSDWDPKFSKLPRTAFPRVYNPYNQEIFRHNLWRKLGSQFMGDRILAIVRPRITGIDIDDRDSFDIAKALIEAKPRPDIVTRYIHINNIVG